MALAPRLLGLRRPRPQDQPPELSDWLQGNKSPDSSVTRHRSPPGADRRTELGMSQSELARRARMTVLLGTKTRSSQGEVDPGGEDDHGGRLRQPGLPSREQGGDAQAGTGGVAWYLRAPLMAQPLGRLDGTADPGPCASHRGGLPIQARDGFRVFSAARVTRTMQRRVLWSWRWRSAVTQAAFGPWSVEAQQFVPAVSPGRADCMVSTSEKRAISSQL